MKFLLHISLKRMSLEAYIDIRFGDPVLSLDMNYEGLVYGSMMGRILYYHFYSHNEVVINEFSDECIRGLWLTYDNSIYAAIGDLKCLIITDANTGYPMKSIVNHQKLHSNQTCPHTQVMMHKDLILIFTLEHPNEKDLPMATSTNSIYISQITTQIYTVLEAVKFPAYTMPFDFDGKRLLWMEWTDSHIPSLHILELTDEPTHVLVELPRNSNGKVGFVRYFNDKLVYVYNWTDVKIMDIEGKPIKHLGSHKYDIAALCIVKDALPPRRDSSFRVRRGLDEVRLDNSAEALQAHSEHHERTKYRHIITVDVKGTISIWDENGLAETIVINQLPELTPKYQRAQYFSMGYPYTICSFGPRIAISTDIGVLVIKSKYLETL